jgi:hypothetical protein
MMSTAKKEISFSKLYDFNNQVYRNIQCVALSGDEFDDLTKDLKAKAYAHKAANAFNKISASIQHHAIDFIFAKKSWNISRFGNGKFPVWYSSLELATSFYETIYSYKKTFIEAPGLDTDTIKMLKTARSVFKINCQAALIDLRADTEKFPELTDKNPEAYIETQNIGVRVSKEGYPGLISKSARAVNGENVIIFKKSILSHPVHEQDYIYEYDFVKNKVLVKQKNSAKIIFEDIY